MMKDLRSLFHPTFAAPKHNQKMQAKNKFKYF